MGVIDSRCYKLHCAVCEIIEEKTVVEKGSNWASSGWGKLPKFDQFVTVSEQDQGVNSEPNLISATCNKCGGSAQITK